MLQNIMFSLYSVLSNTANICWVALGARSNTSAENAGISDTFWAPC